MGWGGIVWEVYHKTCLGCYYHIWRAKDEIGHGGCWSEKGICKALDAGCCCTRKKLRVPSKIKFCVAFGDWISPVLGCICCLLGWELKLWVSFVATLFFFFDLGLKYSCLVVWVDLYCSPFVWIKFSLSPKWKKRLNRFSEALEDSKCS